VALTYAATVIVALAAHQAGRPDLIRSPTRVLAHLWEARCAFVTPFVTFARREQRILLQGERGQPSQRRSPVFTRPAPTIETSLDATISSVPVPVLHGRRLIVVHSIWLGLAGGVLANFLIGLPAYYGQQQTVCSTDQAECTFSDLPTPGNVQALHHLGLSLEGYAAISTCFVVVIALIWLAVGALIFWRKSDTWPGLFTSLFLVIAGSISNNVPNVLVTSGPLVLPYQLFLALVGFAFAFSAAAFLLTFPTGRFAPRWTWVVMLLQVVLLGSLALPAPYSASYWPGAFFAGELLLVYGSPLAVQIYRYRRVYTPIQRQQTKWLVFGVLISIVIDALSFAVGSLVPGLSAPDSLYQMLKTFFGGAFLVSIPLTVGIAILRYQLWDIDTIINKALVYGLLTGLLGTLYAGLVIGLESVAGVLGGQDATNPLVLVVATLAITALFLPLRRRIQALIDRRFYRKKYDAKKSLAAFSAALRNEVNLEQIQTRLLAVLQETVQPAHVSLWLRTLEQQRTAMPLRLEPPAPVSTQPSDG
jgi:hypothetical protein